MSAWVHASPLWLRGGALVVGVLIALYIFDPGKTETTSVKTDTQGKVLETTTTEDERDIWDWVGLLGVPLALAGLGFFQQARSEKQERAEKERSEAQSQAEKDIAESYQREEALQNYLDRLSELLIEKNLIGKVVRHRAAGEAQAKDNQTDLVMLEEGEMLEAASVVIQARTFSLLRRLGDDGDRKGAVIQFLNEAEVISKLKISLEGANLKRANLWLADLGGVNLSAANLTGADLYGANLSAASLNASQMRGADLSAANLSGAMFFGANLSAAKLIGANLSGAMLFGTRFTRADLYGADLRGADLSKANFDRANLERADLSSVKNWTEDQLAKARLSNTKLPEGCNLNPNRDAETEE